MKYIKAKNKINSIQDWLPFKNIYKNGVVELKEKSFIKILKINPINFNLKTELEKKAILNSYKLFLKTCNFDIQILIQSNKKDLSKQISNIYSELEKENGFKINEIAEEYIKYLKEINENKKSSSKNFYLIIKKNENKNQIDRIIQELNDDYYRIKECLARCGNSVSEIKEKDEVIEILYSFFHYKNKERRMKN